MRSAVHEAVLALLASDGAEISVAEVARRAGVNPTSVYRRWGCRDRLIMDAAVSRLRDTSPMPDTGSLRGDLFAWAGRLEERLAEPEGRTLLRALIATMPGHPEAVGARQEFLRHRLDDIARMLDRAAARGEHPPSAERVVERVIAPLYLRVLFGTAEAAPGYGTDLVERLLADP